MAKATVRRIPNTPVPVAVVSIGGGHHLDGQGNVKHNAVRMAYDSAVDIAERWNGAGVRECRGYGVKAHGTNDLLSPERLCVPCLLSLKGDIVRHGAPRFGWRRGGAKL